MAMKRSSYVLNDKEEKVLGAFKKAGQELTIEEMAREAFDTKRYGASPKTRGNSWVRNSVRKLLRLKLLKGGNKSGVYTRTDLKPEEVLRKAEESGKIRTAEEDEKAKAAPKAKKAPKAPKEKAPKKPRAKKAKKEEPKEEPKEEAKEEAKESAA